VWEDRDAQFRPFSPKNNTSPPAGHCLPRSERFKSIFVFKVPRLVDFIRLKVYVTKTRRDITMTKTTLCVSSGDCIRAKTFGNVYECLLCTVLIPFTLFGKTPSLKYQTHDNDGRREIIASCVVRSWFYVSQYKNSNVITPGRRE